MTSTADQTPFPADKEPPTSPIESGKQEKLSSPYLTVPQAADHLRVSKNHLDKLRVSGRGPPFARLGRRKVLYRRSDLDKWVDERIYKSTSQYGL